MHHTTQVFIFIMSIIMVSCVSKREYQAVEYTMIQTEQALRSAKITIGELEADTLNLGQKNKELRQEIAGLNQYSNYSNSTFKNKIEKLEKKLADKENLISGQDRYLLEQTELLRQKEIEIGNQKKELENIKTLLKTRNIIADTILIRAIRALPNYNPQEVNIYRKDGKVYLNIAEAMLFKGNSTNVSTNIVLLQLAQLLRDNSDLAVTIEVHSDNKVPSGMKDNWQFTSRRATAITRILTQNGVPPYQIAPIGKSQYFPIDDNNIKEGRIRNRRVLVILTPELRQLEQLLNRL